MILYKQKQKSIYLMIVKLFFLGISIPKILAKENNDDCEVFKKFISEMGASVDYDVSEKCCSYNSNTVYCDSGQITKLELRSKKHFQGLELSSEIGNFKHLVKLDLKSNDLTGEIPESIGNLTNLKYLDISDNRFKGKLPKSIENLVNLETFNLNSNYGLEGTIPALPKLVQKYHLKKFVQRRKKKKERELTTEV
ncbi:L domain-like protein [Anaeromyces robustus]|uniref:L domain-like protein n=1 Tax=Anaeromyces robustus TaxID=1754192 RepID=A0A1Y1X4Q7_9FUNG|nr:L domain-like protein [Anaeromyces robustus]|eukprot:ORX80628.1 L domain-like protein [Anaeromyces robustus]